MFTELLSTLPPVSEVSLVENTCAHAAASLSSGVSSVVPFGIMAVLEGSPFGGSSRGSMLPSRPAAPMPAHVAGIETTVAASRPAAPIPTPVVGIKALRQLRLRLLALASASWPSLKARLSAGLQGGPWQCPRAPLFRYPHLLPASRPSRQPIARFSSASIGDADKIDKPRESLRPGLCSWNPSAFLRAAAPRAPVIALPPSRKRPVR